MKRYDVAVAGGGPSGTALTSALVAQGLDVVWFAPTATWPTYGMWVDETAADIFEDTWARPIVATKHGVRMLDRTYGRVSNAKLKCHLDTQNARHVDARVLKVELPVIETEANHFEARLFFDCTGHTPLEVTSRFSANAGYQTAYGIVATLQGEPIGGHDMALMDFRDHNPDHDVPSFLYAMRLADGRWFLEETVLVARPAVAISKLKDRLYARLKRRQVTVCEVHDEERCVIPMGHGLPLNLGLTLAFGAAASYPHPATGYMLARTLSAAPIVAECVNDYLTTDVFRIPDAIWPRERHATRGLFLLGMEALLAMSPAQTQRFFDAFFALPSAHWCGYVDDTLTPNRLRWMMFRLFKDVDPSIRSTLIRTYLDTWRF